MKKAEEDMRGEEGDFVLVQPGLFNYPGQKSEKPALLASRCSKCGTTFFPQRTVCRYCLDDSGMENVALSRRGVVYASTVIGIGSPSGIKAPYAFGYVDIPVDGVRVFALFKDADPEHIAPGQEVELVIESIATNSEQKQVMGYKFQAVSRRTVS